jgi:hypothetical protein
LVGVQSDEDAEVVFIDWDEYDEAPDAYKPGVFPAEDLETLHPDIVELLGRLQ